MAGRGERLGALLESAEFREHVAHCARRSPSCGIRRVPRGASFLSPVQADWVADLLNEAETGGGGAQAPSKGLAGVATGTRRALRRLDRDVAQPPPSGTTAGGLRAD